MSTTTYTKSYAASYSTVYVPNTESMSVSHADQATWIKPDAGTMTKLSLTFDVNGTSYYVYLYRRVNGSPSLIGEYDITNATAGSQTIELPSSAWSGLSGDTVYMKFQRRISNNQSYQNIQLVVTYTVTVPDPEPVEPDPDPSTITVASATAGQPQVVTITNSSATVWHKVTWTYGTITSGALTFSAGDRTVSWAVPQNKLEDLYAEFPGQSTITGSVKCQTYKADGTAVNPAKTKNATLTVPVQPEVTPPISTATVATVTAGQAQTVTISNSSSTAWHTVNWTYGSVSSGELTYPASNRAPSWAVPSGSMETLYSEHPGTLTVTGTVTVKTYSERGTYVGTTTISNATLNLPEILPAKSSFTAATVEAGSAQTVTISNADASAKHKVTWTYGSITSGAQSYAAGSRTPGWAIPSGSLASFYAANPTATTVSGTVTVETISQYGTSVGSTSKTAKLKISDSASTRPTITIATEATQDSVSTAAAVSWLQDHTQLSVTPTAAAQAGASLTGIVITTPDGSWTVSNNETLTITVGTAGSYPITATATDSRGYSKSTTSTITVTACSVPVITSLSATRCGSNGKADDEGTYLAVDAIATAPTVSRAIAWSYSVTEIGTGAEVAAGSLGNGHAVIGGALDTETAYTVTVTAMDAIGQVVSASVDVGTAIYTLYRMAGGKAVAFGQKARRYGVEVRPDWPLYTHGEEIMRLIVDVAHPPGSRVDTIDTAWDPNVEWPWTRWGKQSGGWVRKIETPPDMTLSARSAVLGTGRLGLMVLGQAGS